MTKGCSYLVLWISFLTIASSQTTNDTAEIILGLPQNVTIVANQSLYLTCAASGVPTPLITWTTTGLRNLTNNDDISVNQTTITVNGHVLAVSVLKLCAVMDSDMGDYKCIASNGATVENGISSHISKLSLIVNVPGQPATSTGTSIPTSFTGSIATSTPNPVPTMMTQQFPTSFTGSIVTSTPNPVPITMTHIIIISTIVATTVLSILFLLISAIFFAVHFIVKASKNKSNVIYDTIDLNNSVTPPPAVHPELPPDRSTSAVTAATDVDSHKSSAEEISLTKNLSYTSKSLIMTDCTAYGRKVNQTDDENFTTEKKNKKSVQAQVSYYEEENDETAEDAVMETSLDANYENLDEETPTVNKGGMFFL